MNRDSRRESKGSSDSVSKSLREYARGVAGGLLVSLPLLYTMEMWWAGFVTEPIHLLAYIAVTFLLLLGFNRFVGLRQDSSFLEVTIDSVEELGIGLVLSAAVLILLGQISADSAVPEALGKIIVEAMTVAIGVSVGTAQLSNGSATDGERDSGMTSGNTATTFLAQIVIAFCGAVLFAANVAPTEEVLVIAIQAGPAKILSLAILSMAVANLILHYSDFRSSDTFSRVETPIDAFRGTIVMYGTALVASAIILLFFGRFDDVSLPVVVSQTVVLAFPATLGASAGRLLLQS